MAETKDEHRKKCNTLARKFCVFLDERLLPQQYSGSRDQPRGLAQVNLTKLDEGRLSTRNAGVVYAKHRGDKGTFIRFCPFCGTNLEPMLRSKKPAPREG